MSRQVFIGDTNNKARRVHNALIGDNDNKARKVLKAFIGGNDNKARCVYSHDIGAYGLLDPLSSPRAHMAATTVGDYAFFGGGRNDYIYGFDHNAYTAYSKTLTRLTSNHGLGSYAPNTYDLAATTLDNLAFFGGGSFINYFEYESSDYSKANDSSKVVKVYDASLTRVAVLELSKPRHGLAAITVGDYALFAGGMNCVRHIPMSDAESTSYTYEYLNTVDAFGKDLVRISAPALSTGRGFLSAAKINNRAIFAGGMARANTNISYGNGSESTFLAPASKAADAYDTKLTKITISQLSKGSSGMSAASTRKKAVFFGGIYNVSGTPVTDSHLSSDMLYSSSPYIEMYAEDLSHTSANRSSSIATVPGVSTGVGIGTLVITDDNASDTYDDWSQYILTAGGRDLKSEDPYSTSTSNSSAEYYSYGSRDEVKYIPQVYFHVSNAEAVLLRPLSYARSYLSAALVGDYAIFAGGSNTEEPRNQYDRATVVYSNKVEAYFVGNLSYEA